MFQAVSIPSDHLASYVWVFLSALGYLNHSCEVYSGLLSVWSWQLTVKLPNCLLHVCCLHMIVANHSSYSCYPMHTWKKPVLVAFDRYNRFIAGDGPVRPKNYNVIPQGIQKKRSWMKWHIADDRGGHFQHSILWRNIQFLCANIQLNWEDILTGRDFKNGTFWLRM